MRYLFGFMCVLALGVAGCGESDGKCRSPLSEYCTGSSCPTHEQAIAAAEEFNCDRSVCWSEAGRCGDFRYVRAGCNGEEDALEYFDASGTLVAVHWSTDECGHVCWWSCSVNYGPAPECELEQEQDLCDQRD
jgi:hypothetical protein